MNKHTLNGITEVAEDVPQKGGGGGGGGQDYAELLPDLHSQGLFGGGGGGRTPLIDHTHFVGNLYWHVIYTTLGLMMMCTQKKLAFMNCFGGED